MAACGARAEFQDHRSQGCVELHAEGHQQAHQNLRGQVGAAVGLRGLMMLYPTIWCLISWIYNMGTQKTRTTTSSSSTTSTEGPSRSISEPHRVDSSTSTNAYMPFCVFRLFIPCFVCVSVGFLMH